MERKNNWKAWLYLAPVLILMAIFTVYPLINTILISFKENYSYIDGSFDGWTFDNYLKILQLKPISYSDQFQTDGSIAKVPVYYQDFFKYALPNTLKVVFITVPLSIIISLAVAVGLNSIKVLNKVFSTIFFVPYVTNSMAVGMVFVVLFGNNISGNDFISPGLINWLFNTETLFVDPGASAANARLVLYIYIIWNNMPFKILIFLSGLQGIDKQYYQAAKIDSTGKLKTFWRITVPLLSPQILYVLITSFIGAFKEYSSVVALFTDNPAKALGTIDNQLLTIGFFIYSKINTPDQIAYAAAGAVVLFVIIMVFTIIQQKVSKKRVHY